MNDIVDMFKRTTRCAYCHALKIMAGMLRVNGAYYCNEDCHHKHNRQRL